MKIEYIPFLESEKKTTSLFEILKGDNLLVSHKYLKRAKEHQFALFLTVFIEKLYKKQVIVEKDIEDLLYHIFICEKGSLKVKKEIDSVEQIIAQFNI